MRIRPRLDRKVPVVGSKYSEVDGSDHKERAKKSKSLLVVGGNRTFGVRDKSVFIVTRGFLFLVVS